MSEQITGAQSLITLAGGGRRRAHLRHPGRRDPPGVRPADGLQDPAHPGAARAGRRPRGPGLRRGDRPGRRLHGDVGPRRDQPGDADRRRAHGLRADGRGHRPGRRRGDRDRRLPGGRHPRHHDADHQAQLPRHRPRRDPAARSRRRSTSPRPAGPARCSSTSPSPRCRRTTTFQWPSELHLPGYRPVTRPHAKQIREAARLMLESRRPVLYVGGGTIRAGASAELRPAGRAHRHAGRHHADGPRRVPRQPPAAPRHARHARHGGRGGGAAEERPDHQPRRPLRRPGHRQPRLVRPAAPGSSTPTSTRPRSARTATPTCRSSATSARSSATWSRRCAPRRDDGNTGDYEGWVQFLAGVKSKYPLGYDTSRGQPRAAVRHRAPRRDRRPGRDLHRGRRPAPDVGRAVRRLREAQDLDQLRRPRHDGLRGPGRDGRQGRHAGLDGLGDRRRRLLPDDQPGARHLRDQRHPDQGRGDQQRVARHGAPVADAVLQLALLQHRPRVQAHPRLRQARRGLRLRRPGLRQRRGRRRDHQQGHGDQRRARRRRLPGPPGRHGLADGRRRHQQRRHQVRARPRARRSTRTTSDDPGTRCPSWSRTSPASWPGSRACSAAAASTSSPSRSARPSPPTSPG